MLQVNQLGGFGGKDPGHKYWRIYCLTGTNNLVGTLEIEMRSTVGGADECNGGTAIGSAVSDPAFYSAAKAFNNLDTSTDPYGWLGVGSPPAGMWIGYEFPQPVDIKQIIVLSGLLNLYRFATYRIEWSEDGSSWITVGGDRTATYLAPPEPIFGLNVHSYMDIRVY